MEGKQQHSWESREDKLFFRGAKTGFRSYIADDLQFMNSSEVDVEFSGWTGDSSRGFHSLPEHCDYRYTVPDALPLLVKLCTFTCHFEFQSRNLTLCKEFVALMCKYSNYMSPSSLLLP